MVGYPRESLSFIPRITFAVTPTLAFTALALAFWIYVEVFAKQLMSALAHCLSRVQRCWTITTMSIDGDGDRFEVGRIAAAGISAKMIYGQTRRNGPDEDLIRDSVRKTKTTFYHDTSIAARGGRNPFPATTWRDYAESFDTFLQTQAAF